MPDISMCGDSTCPKARECYRFRGRCERVAHDWVYDTLKGTEYDLDSIAARLAEHLERELQKETP